MMVGRNIGNYVVKRKVGEGGMGVVYLAEHPTIGRRVAIKILLPEFSHSPQVVARFFNEARSVNEIRNEHIIDIIDFGELAEGSYYIIMEYLEGQSLTEVLAKEGRFSVERAAHIARGIGRALSAAHAHGIVHRDLKPDNIFLVPRGDDPDFVKVLDFGIAKLTQASSPLDLKTKTGAIIGTPAYMSPEQCRGTQIDHRTDIYALGVILYQMLTGHLPFVADGLGELLLKHMTEAPKPLHEIDASIPVEAEQAVMHALEKDPDSRYQRVEGLIQALPGAGTGPVRLQAATVLGTAPSAPTVLSRSDTLGAAAAERLVTTGSRRKSPAFVVGGGVGLLAAVVAAVLFGSSRRGGQPPPVERTPAVAPATSPAAPPKTPSERTPASTTAHVKLRALPPEARLRLDGELIPNPYERDLPRDGIRHQVVANAPGYQSRSEWVTFDQPRQLELTLARSSQQGATKRPTSPHGPPAARPTGKPETPPEDGKPVYKGTKGKLITEFPGEKP